MLAPVTVINRKIAINNDIKSSSVEFTGNTLDVLNISLKAKNTYQCIKNIEKLYFAIISILLLNQPHFFICSS